MGRTWTMVGVCATGPQTLTLLDKLMKAGFRPDALSLVMPATEGGVTNGHGEEGWLSEVGARATGIRSRLSALRASGVVLLPDAECLGAGPVLDGLRTAAQRQAGSLLPTALESLGFSKKRAVECEQYVKSGHALLVIQARTPASREQAQNILTAAGVLAVVRASGWATTWRALRLWWRHQADQDHGRSAALYTNPTALVRLLKDAADKWSTDRAPRLGAALAYYTIFSLGPLLFIAVSIAGLLFGSEAAQGYVVQQFERLVGHEGAQTIQTMMQTAAQTSSGITGTLVAVGTLLIGASGVFGQLQDALNAVWGIAPKGDRGIIGFIRDRFISLLAVLGAGFLLLVSLVLTAGIAAVGDTLSRLLPAPEFVLQAVNVLVTFGLITLLFAMIFKLLPDAQVAWGDVWIGGGTTALLFLFGQFAI